MRSALTTSAEGTGLPARHARSYVRILERLCGDADLPAAAGDVLREVVRAVGCEAAGIRVCDGRGDYPYLAHVGFDRDFLGAENFLVRRDAEGRAVIADDGSCALEGLCGVVIRGRSDPSRSFFTQGGSFWTNSLGFVLSGKLADDLGEASRGTCAARGYESIAISPVRAGGRILGVVQANGREQDLFSPVDVEFLERVGGRLGAVVEAWRRREELLALVSLFDDRRRGAESLLAVGQIVSAIAHDIKNPLAGMMLAAQRLRRALDSFPGGERLARIADHLCTSIEALSAAASKVSSRAREPGLEMSPENLNDVLGSAMVLAARRAREQGVRVVLDLTPPPARVLADAHFLRRAFLDLLNNAMDAMPSGGELRVSTRILEDGWVETAIADTGAGVGAEGVEALFDPFVSTKPGAAGLGLPLARRIAELHGGAVSLRPGKAGGTEAVVRVPLATPVETD